jgi:O-antigen/teichoic acid export membrane protein
VSGVPSGPPAPGNVAASAPKAPRLALLRSAGARQGFIMGTSMILAGGLDYGVNVLAGRWLEPVDFGVFVTVTAILQVLLSLSIAIRMVVAYYTAELSAQAESARRVGSFVRRAWRWSWQWGLLATALAALASPILAPSLQMPDAWPLWAASLMVLALFTREATYGALQGIQAFTGLGVVQVVQASLRLVFAAILVWAGWRAVGAILAQPLAGIAGVGLALWWLRPHFRERGRQDEGKVSWHYSASTMLGLAVFGLMTNLDALFVKRFYSPRIAGYYGPVVTLERISLFLPWAIGFVLFPKVAQRKATGRDARPILLLALAAALLPGLGVTTLYFLFPGTLVRSIFTKAYADPGVILGLASLAATLYAGIHIWLNYALSLKRNVFVYALAGVLALQGLGMYALGRNDLVRMTVTMVLAGLMGNLAGFATTWFPARGREETGTSVAGRPGAAHQPPERG